MQYAAYQLKWLNSRITVFGPDTLVKLDLNNKEKYRCAKDQALTHIKNALNFYKQVPCDFKQTYISRDDKKLSWSQRRCDPCDRLINGQ